MKLTKQQFRELMDKPNFFLISGNSCSIDKIVYTIKCDDINNTVELIER